MLHQTDSQFAFGAETLTANAEEPYALQLARGFRGLRFAPPLESEYRRTLFRDQRQPALVCATLALVIWLGFAVFDLVRLDVLNNGIPSGDLLLLLAVRWAVLVVLLVFLGTSLRERAQLERSAMLIFGLIGNTAAMNAAIYKANGLAAAETSLVVVVMAAFLPIGLTFYGALGSALTLVLVTVVTGLIWLDGNAIMGHLGLAMVMAIAAQVGAVGNYLREHAHRRQFLLTAILARQAQLDSLTELANRRLFERHARTALAQASRRKNDMVLAVIDIDHFKAFNDRFGHAAGDVALQRVAELIRGAARRPADMAARLGGEEFVLLLDDCDLNRARPVLEALRLRVSAMIQGGSDAAPVSISIGATHAGSGESLESIYNRADKLLYASKTAGRDRLTTG